MFDPRAACASDADAPPCPPKPARITIDEFRRELVAIQMLERSKKTAKRTDAELRKLQLLGLTWVHQIDRLALSKWRAGHGNSVRDLTLKGYYSAIKSALNYAVACGYLERNPALAMPMRFSTQKINKKRCLTPNETMSLFAQLRAESAEGWEEHRLYALAVMVFGVGLRPGEAYGIRGRDLDLTEGILDLSGRRLKTEGASVPVGLPDFVVDVTRNWLPRCRSEWLYPHAHLTGPWTGGSPGKKPVQRLQQAAQRAGIPYVTFHMGRHGWATLAATKWGLSKRQIASHLRHRGDETQEHYLHADGHAMRPVIARIFLPGFEPETTSVSRPETTPGNRVAARLETHAFGT